MIKQADSAVLDLAKDVSWIPQARGKVVKAGRTLTLAQTDVYAEAQGKERLVAYLTATLMTIDGRPGIVD